jgi:hydrogenase-4 component F
MLHMVFHSATKPLLFFCAGNVQQHYGSAHFRKITGVIRTLPWTGGLFLTAALAVTGLPPFSLFQSEFMTLSAALAADHVWPAVLMVAGVVTIFAGFLAHISKLSLGRPARGTVRGVECPWKLGAMLLAAAPVVALGVALPGPLYELARRAAQTIGGAP